jgi:hypothetical protein
MLDRPTAKPELLVRPISFTVDLEADLAEVMIASSAHDITWNVHFVITPAPANPDDWNQKIIEAYDRIVSLVQSEVGPRGSPPPVFVVGASGAHGPSSIVRLIHSEFTGSTEASKLRFFGELSGADMIELTLG